MPMDSLHSEMEAEAELRAGERAAVAEATAPPPQPEYEPTSDPEELISEAGEKVDVMLDATVEQEAAKIDLTQVADVIDPLPPASAATAPEKAKLNDCGLPQQLVDDPGKITAYCVQHGITQPMLAKIEYTAPERDAYEVYKTTLQRRSRRPIAKDNFTAALRMFKKNYPLAVTALTDLNTIKFHG